MGLAPVRFRWDNTTMKLVADSKGRIASMELFTPGKPFSAERQADGSIRLIELVEKPVPEVKLVRNKDGTLTFPQPCRLDRKTIVESIRADRDRQ